MRVGDRVIRVDENGERIDEETYIIEKEEAEGVFFIGNEVDFVALVQETFLRKIDE